MLMIDLVVVDLVGVILEDRRPLARTPTTAEDRARLKAFKEVVVLVVLEIDLMVRLLHITEDLKAVVVGLTALLVRFEVTKVVVVEAVSTKVHRTALTARLEVVLRAALMAAVLRRLTVVLKVHLIKDGLMNHHRLMIAIGSTALPLNIRCLVLRWIEESVLEVLPVLVREQTCHLSRRVLSSSTRILEAT